MNFFSSIKRCSQVLTKSDQFKIKIVILAQLLLSLLDIVAVALFGIIGAISVRGVQSRDTSTFLDPILYKVGLEGLNLQIKVAAISGFACALLMLKTLVSALIVKRSLSFLGRKSATISSHLISQEIISGRLPVKSSSPQSALFAVTTGVQNIILGVIGTTVTLASDLSLLFLIVIALFLVDWLTALVTIVFFSFVGFTLYLSLHRKAAHLGLSQAEVTIKSNREILTVFRSYPEIFVRNTGYQYLNRVSSLRFSSSQIAAETSFLPYVSKYVIETSMVLGILMLSFVQFWSRDAASALGILTFFIASATRLAPAVLRLQQGAITINYSFNASKTALALLDYSSTETNNDTNYQVTSKKFSPRVEVKNVDFTFADSSERLLKEIEFNVAEGEFLAIVGPSGAGKSTLVEVLLGVRRPTNGEVFISDLPAIMLPKLWPGKISYVAQDVSIFEGSLRENLLLGLDSSQFPDAFLRKCLEMARLSEFMRMNALTLDTTLAENGGNLSGGQKQRIGIARALVTRPELLILDEATSALDGVTEFEISQAIAGVESIKTLIVIAHRLSTIRSADKVLYLDKGRIRAIGSFEEVKSKIPEFEEQTKAMGVLDSE